MKEINEETIRQIGKKSAENTRNDEAIQAINNLQNQQSKAIEYQQIAALLALQIDIIFDTCERTTTKESMFKHVQILKEYKDKIISDEQFRNSQYNVTRILFNQ